MDLSQLLTSGLRTRKPPELPEVWVAYDDAEELANRCLREGVEILGLEGFQSADDYVIASMEMLTDFNEIAALPPTARVAASVAAAQRILPLWASFSPAWVAFTLGGDAD